MTEQEICKLRELKGRLEARAQIIENDLEGLEELSPQMESQYYIGHTRGRIETMVPWHNDILRSLEIVNSYIEKAENA